ncbi:hypothetical protein IWQ62_004940 [Dispira parvispora]|uniref:Uncharacterized protein n=1 Tax=Dispira parvispora TaxID=1520584 RepID=A0A9W8AKY3_9FUNG|nr:hypothetical protein IWQ62_004940 [Dispira parvispora]
MWLPNFRFMEDEATNAASGSPAAWFFMVWTEFWMHAGIIYSIIVVAAVCIKMLVARSRLRRLGGIASKNGISRSLICNAGLIIAYPTVLFIVYVPYVFHAWLIGSSTGTFFICWSVASFALFAAQGIFSFAIVLFHPVMLALYRQRNFGLRPLWSRLSHPFKGSADKIYHSSGTPLYSQFSTTRNLSSENPIVDIQTHPPQIKTMDMGPGVASLFNGSLGDDNIQTATDRQNLGELDEVAVIGVGNSELDQSPLETHCLYHESTLL